MPRKMNLKNINDALLDPVISVAVKYTTFEECKVDNQTLEEGLRLIFTKDFHNDTLWYLLNKYEIYDYKDFHRLKCMHQLLKKFNIKTYQPE